MHQGHSQTPIEGHSLQTLGSGEFDLGPLAWIMDEVRKSVDGAIKQARRFAMELVDGSSAELVAVDASMVRTAKLQLHQTSGALDMVGMGSAARFLQCMEGVLQRYTHKPELCTENTVQVLERAGFAVLEYLDVLLSGQTISAVALFPQYRDVQALLGNDKVHPADLWECPKVPESAPSLSATVPVLGYSPETRSALEQAVLKVVKTADTTAAGQLRVLSQGLMQKEGGPPAVFWGVAAGFFDALAHQRLPADVYVKRMSSRVLLQYGTLAKGDKDIPARLLQDLLFFCVQAGGLPDAPAALQAVRNAMGSLPQGVAVDYGQPQFGLYDPALLVSARKRIAAAAETWSALVGGDKSKIKAAVDQFGLVCDSLQRLQPESKELVQALNRVMSQIAQRGVFPDTAVAMEVATAVLYLQAVFSTQNFADAQTAVHANVLAQRLLSALAGEPPQPLESWMEELYRKASDAQTMGSVVGELRSTLEETEKVLDQFFRQPSNVTQLSSVVGHLTQMRGVLSVLGLDQAALAMVRMREVVEQLLNGTAPAQTHAQLFERLGNSLGAMGFLIDMLSYQRAMARKLFVYDERRGELQLLMGRTKAVDMLDATPPAAGDALEQRGSAAVDPQAPALAPTLPVPRTGSSELGSAETKAPFLVDTPEAVVELPVLESDGTAVQALQAPDMLRVPQDVGVPDVVGAPDRGGNSEEAVEAVATSAPSPSEHIPVLTVIEEEADAELLSIFLEEAREVVETGKSAVHALAEQPANLVEQASLRRAFHTLKGSSRMVALNAFGEAAWAFEQMLNAWVAEQKPMPHDMQGLSLQALQAFADWVDAIEAGQAQSWRAAPFQASADAMRVQALWVPLDVGALPAATHSDLVSLLEPDFPEDTEVLGAIAHDAASGADTEEPLHAEPQAHPGVDAAFFEMGGPAEDLLESPPMEVSPADVALDFSALEAALDVPEQPLQAEDAAEATEPAEPFKAEAMVSEIAAPQTAPDIHPAATDAAQPVSFLQEVPPAADTAGAEDAPKQVCAASTLPPSPVPPQGALDDGVLDGAVRQVGPLQIPEALFTVYLGEAQEWSQQLRTALQDWQATPGSAQPEAAVVCAHGLAGSSATVGFQALSEFARTLEHALQHVQPLEGKVPAVVLQTLVLAADEIEALLHQFAAGFLRTPQSRLQQALHAVLTLEVADPAASTPARPDGAVHVDANQPPQAGARSFAASASVVPDMVGGGDVHDTIDPDLFPIFEEEAVELLPTLGAAMRQWAQQPSDLAPRSTVLRVLHTLKGSARLAGAMRLGEMAHHLESAIEALNADSATSADIDPLLEQVDALQANFDRLRVVGADAEAPVVVDAIPPQPDAAGLATWVEVPPPGSALPAPRPVAAAVRNQAQPTVRVRSQLLDRLINEAGEVLIARSRLDARMAVVHNALADLGGNLERLRQQLRDLEVQAESQMQSRKAFSRDVGGEFDPLEFDRFTRVQELTRMMAESVNDVATVQRHLQREVTGAEDDLVAQGRQARELQRGLLRTRMVEFDSVAERLYAVVRNAAKETGKQVKLDIHGGTIEVDRGVLERMAPAFEHLLRNCVGHGIETPAERSAAGKPVQGSIAVEVQQDGNDVAVAFRDDGTGLNVARIRTKALEQGLVQPDEVVDGARAAELIFMPGFSTATVVTGLSGRGIGMDVLRSEVQSLGGRIETTTTEGQGSCFRMVLPLTTAVTQVLMVRVGEFSVGVPANLVETVRRLPADELDEAYRQGSLRDGSGQLPFYWAGAVWQQSVRSTEEAVGRTRPVLMLRSAAQRIALHVDEVLGNQEVVIKHLGPQMARLPGLTGMSVLPSGAVVLIYNPVALTAVYADRIRALGAHGQGQGAAEAHSPADLLPQWGGGTSQVPLVMVVDDSITVRRVTQRLLQREGYRVVMAADGVQALETLQGELPCVVLSDIEMPRMDGFDLARQIRADERLQAIPLVMITSRTADKHREHALSLGANHYLGKPYRDEELMHLVRHYASLVQPAAGGAEAVTA